MIYSEDTFDDSEGAGRVCFYCSLCLFPSLMSHPPWGRELLRCVPDTFNKDAPLKKKSNQWQRSESPKSLTEGRQLMLQWSCPGLFCTFLLCSVIAFSFSLKWSHLSIDFLGFSTFPGSLVLHGPSHVLWVCFQLQAFSCSSALPLTLPHGHFTLTACWLYGLCPTFLD